jgi:thiol:disulfide interchange protein DsbD
MPCVLPVISLKILAFVNNANEDPSKIFRLGIMFALGVLTSFLILAIAVITLQAAGERIGWGFQFQSPGFVAAITAVIFLFSLSLLGVFEINVHVGLWARGGGRAYVDDFLNGMLATLLATPCTAPMLGPAVAFAFTQPPAGIIAIFMMVGMGLALPYLLLTANPKWLRFVPWPGPWMETFKHVMGFVLMATMLWLLSVFGAQTGVQGLIRLLAFLMALGILAWMHGRFITLSSTSGARVAVWSITAIVLLLGYQRILRDAVASPPHESELVRPTPSLQEGSSPEVTWAPFSKQALEQAVAEGNTVFLDFTAEWCWTCKVNEKTVLADAEVEDLFLRHGVVTLKGDWTRRDPEITDILKQHGRAGVPFYAVYPADNPQSVIVLPELINKKLVLDSLRRAGRSRSAGA